MIERFKITRFLVVAVFALFLDGKSNAQTKPSGDDAALFNEIARMDSVLFNAFNKRDIELFKSLFTEDLEFFHDRGGLTNYDHTIEFMKSTAAGNNQLRRELVPGSLEVYTVPGYGAMEIGSHRFCHIENGKEDCGVFRFVHIWQKKDGTWKISRVISYGH